MMCSKCGEEKVRSESGRRRCRSCERAYQKRYYHAHLEASREKGRRAMRKRLADPVQREALNTARRGNAKFLAQGRAYNRNLRDQHFFRWRARLLNRTGRNVTAQQLAALWKKQRGRCALSGAKLGRDAHIDHIKPKSKGGQTTLDNIRWLDPWVNVALQNLTDGEFAGRCAQVAEYIGRLLKEIE